MAGPDGSVLLDCLARSFKNILERDFDQELLKDSKEKSKKKLSKKKKEDKEKQKKDKKTVHREGRNSLITYPNPSPYSVFSHIRHFVLQQELCDMYNVRNSQESQSDESDDEDVKKEQSKSKTLPEIVNLGIHGVFAILSEVWQTTPSLCLRVLEEFLNILQGQAPGGLKDEPVDSTAALFDLLMKIVTNQSDLSTISLQLSSMASSCLVSLAIAVGNTSRLLTSIEALLLVPPDISQQMIKVPEIMRSLQVSVQAVLVGSPYEADWLGQGVPAKSIIDQWTLSESLTEAIDRSSSASSITSNGCFLFVHGAFGLLKVGSGYGNTVKGHVYQRNNDFFNNTAGKLMYASNSLYFVVSGQHTITVINPDTLLSQSETLELEDTSACSYCMFSDGKNLRQIVAKKEGGFVIQKLTTICSPVPVVEEKSLQLAQKSVLCLGRAKYDYQSSLHALYQDSSCEVTSLTATRSFAAVATSAGKLYYQGSGLPFGIVGKDVPKGQWVEVELPDPKAKIERIACDNSGSFCLAVSDKGVVYFSGTNKKGEAAENPVGGNRQQPKPIKLKRINKLKDQKVISVSCSSHLSAIITEDGKLYMFGSVEDELTDKSSGVVAGMLGIPASHVSLGRSHVCVLTQHGTIYTFGTNQYGQCGRNYIPPSEGINVMDVESSDDDDGDDGICPSGAHTWTNERCMICVFCKFCTGYGPSCCNEGIAGREPGNDCGCGAGDSGCSNCGCCKVCAGESDRWGGGIGFHELEEVEPEIYEKVRRIRKREKKEKKEKKEKEAGGGMGLQLLFGEGGVDEGASLSEKKEEEVQLSLSTSKPAQVVLDDEQTVVQISCGAFHTAILLLTGEVYVFGNGNHGQLGQGNNKPCGIPVKVPLPGPAQQVSCGDNHTVVLLSNGEIYTFGKYQEGQLGRGPDDADDDTWHMVPGLVQSLGVSYRSKWILASGNQTFIAVDESLVSEDILSHCEIFSHPSCIGLVPPGQPKGNLIVINPSNYTAKKLDGDDQQCLNGSSLCIDAEYNVLWSYTPSSLGISCFNPLAADVKDSSSGISTILNPRLSLPNSKESFVTRHHIALNMLSSVNTLATHPPLSVKSLSGRKLKEFAVDDYHVLTRFNKSGGGWGYNVGSVEAVLFCPDHDVLLGGFGLYGGRGQYNAEVKVYESSESGDVKPTDDNLVVSTEEKGYSCERNKTFKSLFEHPVVLVANNWYLAHIKITSPSGASTDAGSSGQAQVTGPDSVVFNFKNSRESNNGTDVGSGQIPEFLYRIPEFEQETDTSLQLLDKEFAVSVSPCGLQSLQNILEWSWNQLLSADDPNIVDRLKIVVECSLSILSSHIKEVYPAKGINKSAPSDSPELAECVFKTLCLIKVIFSSRQSSSDQYQDIIKSCRECFTSCFHAFYPSSLLKWFALCNLLHQIDPSDIIVGFPGDNLLSAVLEALSSPSYSYIGLNYDNSYSFETALHNSSQEEKFPILTESMQQKTMMEFSTGVGDLLSFTEVSGKLLALVSETLKAQLSQQDLHSTSVVQKAGEFLISRSNELALCCSYPEIAAATGLPVTATKKKEKLLESNMRFSSREIGLSSQIVTDVVFSVNCSILFNGVTLYVCENHQSLYTINLLKDDAVLMTHEGSFSRSDCHDNSELVNVHFPDPVKLESELVYTLRVKLVAPSYTMGSDGEVNISGPAGINFTLHSTGLGPSDPTSGPVAKFIYSSISSPPQNVVQLSVHMASLLLGLTVSFLERVMGMGMNDGAISVLSSSFLLSHLLPNTLAHLGPIAILQPKSSVAVLDLIQNSLPIVSAAVKELKKKKHVSQEYIDERLIHYASVETDHPYKPASVSHFRVKFPDRVKWMSLEFDPKCGFAQREDKLADLMIPRQQTSPSSDSNDTSNVIVSPMIDVSFDDVYADYEHFGLSAPAGLVLLPGNEVHIIVNTDTEYEKRDKNNHYGIKCQLIGYEWSNDTSQCLMMLEKELVTLGAVCAGSLLSDDLNLPYCEELPVSNTHPNDSERADMRIVQAAAQEVFSSHSHILSRGLNARASSIQTILRGDISGPTNIPEQQFLQEFIQSKSDSLGGRLARWLQPDRSVDPNGCDLELVSVDTPIMVGKGVEFIVHTRDQDGQVVFVDGMNVDVKAEWKGQSLEGYGTSIPSAIDKVTGVRRPTYKRPYNPTMLGTSNHFYHSISMMMPYSDYSFEELRFYSPKVLGSVERMSVTSNDDGTYLVSWVPSCSGAYDICICIDGALAGTHQTYTVLPSEEEKGTEEEETKDEDSEGKVDEEVIVTELIKKKVFPVGRAAGLRIRSEPSFAAAAIGLIKPGDVVYYSEEIENDVGKWIKLTQSSLSSFGVVKSLGYAQSYNKMKDEVFLEEGEPEEIKHVMKKHGKQDKRLGGPGTYSVVQCGAAGHNVRSKPNMKGCPIGRLAKGSTVEVVEEVENDDGVWLKLSVESIKKHAQSSFVDGTEGWTLVVHPSGRIFLAQEGDEFHNAITGTSSVHSFPTAASVFGTQQQSLFGDVPIPPPPPPPLFKFEGSGIKLAFGKGIDLEEKKEDVVSEENEQKNEKEEKKDKDEEIVKSPVFNIGVVTTSSRGKPSRRRRGLLQTTKEDIKEEEEEEEAPPSLVEGNIPQKEPSPFVEVPVIKRQALSPAVAECQRAVFAAFLWQEGLVHDSMASAVYLKFNPNTPSKMDVVSLEGDLEENGQKESLPSTLNHLITFWDEISQKVVENSASFFTIPRVPSFAQELQKRYDEEKKEMERVKKEKEKKSGGGGALAVAGAGSTMCELCESHFPDPVTYHMKDSHPGCGKHANGWGYNSRGSYCSGWAGNCGDGGRGGSTWYLMCKDCHTKYVSMKEENKRVVVKPVSVPKMKTRKPGKARVLPIVSSVQGMTSNAKFLLEVTSYSDGGKRKSTTSVVTSQSDISRQLSTPDDVKERTASLTRSQDKSTENQSPVPTFQSGPLNSFVHSISISASDNNNESFKRTLSESGDADSVPVALTRQMTVTTPTSQTEPSASLVNKPSMSLAKLMYNRSCQSKDNGYSRVMNFVTQYHDLDGLKATMKQMMRLAYLKSFALKFLQWLLHESTDPTVIHDILWQFMSSVSDHPMVQSSHRTKSENDDKKDDKENKIDWELGKNPLTGLEGAGTALIDLRAVFHSFLLTIGTKISQLPVGSIAQQMALKCWCLEFQAQDHSFLLQSRVFANISEALSNMEEVEGDSSQISNRDDMGVIETMCNVLMDGKLKVSSNDAMSNSLNDGSTETFWESRDEPRGKPRSITVTFEKKRRLFGASIHIDNTKDSAQSIESVALHVGSDEDCLKEVDKCKLLSSHVGWKTLIIPEDYKDSLIIRFELRGNQNNIRVRQIMVLGLPDKPVICPFTSIAMQKDCETEALRLFRLLTAQVFGGLLNVSLPKNKDEIDGDTEEEEEDGDGEASSMANILFNKTHLSSLQKAVCKHIIDSVHTESLRIKEDWTIALKDASTPLAPDTYCYELLTMLEGLSQNELGCNYLAEQSQLVQDLVSLLHTASVRIKLQTCSLLRHILPYIKPRDFANMISVTVLPPLGYSAIAEAVNSAATINQLGLLDCLLAVISKALSVQIKVKGRGTDIIQKLTGDVNISAVTLASLKNIKPIVGEANVRIQRWYLQGSVEREVAMEVVKLLKDMMKLQLKGQWRDYAKSAIGQAVLHLTKINEEARNAEPGMYSHTFWLCLAALCVIDEEHAEALSSGQWLGQDGKPQAKPLCDNHDDGETKALILCDSCGNLCGECDRVLHYHKRTSNHSRQVFKEEEEAVKVDLHEGCGRIKLYWTMALADSRTLKGLIEFKDTIGGGGKGACRFCGTTSNTGLLAIGNVCADPECQERAKSVCTKMLSCGHLCCGVADEKKCLPCLHGCTSDSCDPPLKQDSDDMCMICYTEGLSCAPSIQLECGHVFHYHCCYNALNKRWSGPRITFRFMFCSICEDKPIAHPHLAEVATPLSDLYSDVTRKCLMRLEYENLTKCEAITSKMSKFYEKPLEYAMWKYAYYVCYKCQKAYYGGEANCAEGVASSDEYDPTELVCPSCADTGGTLQVCPKHGTDFLEHKCRYCCSVAVYYCFGTTHFCNPCHDDFQRLTSMAKSELPQCPVGPRARPLSGTECPLHVKHPPTGEEFALGCGVCRNAQTF